MCIYTHNVQASIWPPRLDDENICVKRGYTAAQASAGGTGVRRRDFVATLGECATTLLQRLDRGIGAIVAAAKWLALPLIVLLFLQWPLRDLLRLYSREANDLGQVIFALFVAVSVTAATRAGTHLSVDLLARHYSARTRRRLERIGAAFGLLPWALFVLIAGKTSVLTSLRDLEAFQDSGNPGYFLIKLALWVIAILVVGQVIVDICRRRKAPGEA